MFGFIIQGAKVVVVTTLFAAFLTIMGVAFCAPPAHAQNIANCATEQRLVESPRLDDHDITTLSGPRFHQLMYEHLLEGATVPSGMYPTRVIIAKPKTGVGAIMFYVGENDISCDFLPITKTFADEWIKFVHGDKT